ncbi:hypothetical protein E0W68_09130 [Flavobacterium salilacus subsp. salilacus]|uniref:hypothetical protein n=1 Tax=Flavobacterium TaxID=237 RepID=UPI0010755ED8|nr:MULTISPECIES: hypothetical protein [Flavobacterium]KAF2518478.1 hypothetical protein E0W68_09130 [Flavobacterium salilacus subsp. salilacus]MBE1615117.1 hypothetical protein [Flavobacterium sp. SaA2.13]
MSDNFTSFRKYPDASQAKGLEQFLSDNNIECLYIDNSPRLGTAFGGEMQKEYEIQIQQPDFEKATLLLEELAKEEVNQLPDDYYLLEFTDEELIDVVVKKDEWNEFDYLLAIRLLKERGKTIDEELITSLNKRRIEDLAKPESDQTAWIIAGYAFALMGGLLGLITGYVIWTADKTLPNGEKVYTYSKCDRKHGKRIVILSVIVLPVLVAYRVFK